MVTIRGHYDGRQVILDEPAPTGLPSNAPVRVIFEADQASEILGKVAELGTQGGLPGDFSQQHEHYTKGLPRR